MIFAKRSSIFSSSGLLRLSLWAPLPILVICNAFLSFHIFVYFIYVQTHWLRDNSSNHIFFSSHAQPIAFKYEENICKISAEYIKRITLSRSKKEVAMKTWASLSVVFLFVPKYTDNKCIRQTLANPPQKFSITYSNQRNSEKRDKNPFRCAKRIGEGGNRYVHWVCVKSSIQWKIRMCGSVKTGFTFFASPVLFLFLTRK